MTAPAFSPVPTITCGACLSASDALAWCETPISGELPRGEYQCPKCGYAFRREPSDNIWKPITLVPISTRL